MAKAKKKSLEEVVNDIEKQPISNSASNTNGSANTEVICVDKDFDALTHEIEDFSQYKFGKIDDYSQWEKIFSLYDGISKKIHDYGERTDISEQQLQDNLQELYGNLSAVYDDLFLYYTKWNFSYTKAIDERVAKSQGMNFTIFSIFMTLLTFLLTNIVVGSQTEFDIKKLVIANLTILLIVSILFLFIGFFLGLVGIGNKIWLKIIKMIILFLMPVLIGACLICAFLFL